MQAELVYLHSPDTEDLRHYMPKDPSHFGILVQAMVRPQGEQGEESFDFFVCTPSWLTDQLRRKESVFGRGYLFLIRYDYDLLFKAIKWICSQVQGADWLTIAGQLGQYGKWEFDDYEQ